MSDQRGQKCAEHPGTCFCDEREDREQGIHRPGGVADAFGGYQCVCGDPLCPGGRFPFVEDGAVPPARLAVDECVYRANHVVALCVRIDDAHLRVAHPLVNEQQSAW